MQGKLYHKIFGAVILTVLSLGLKAQVQLPSRDPNPNAPNGYYKIGDMQSNHFEFVEVDTFCAKYPTLIKHLDHNFYYTDGNCGAWHRLVPPTDSIVSFENNLAGDSLVLTLFDGRIFTVASGSSSGGVQSVTGNIVDNTDPFNPIVTGITQQDLDDTAVAIRADIPSFTPNTDSLFGKQDNIAQEDRVFDFNNYPFLLFNVPLLTLPDSATSLMVLQNDSIQRIAAGYFAPNIHPDICLTGCTVTVSDTATNSFTYVIAASTYYINNVFHSSPQTTVTLSPSDVTNDRVDLFVLQSSNTSTNITGTAANPALDPDYDASTQFPIGRATVSAGSVAPTVTTKILYKENVGAPTEYNASSSHVSINVNSTNNPWAGSKDIEFTAVSNGRSLSLTWTSTIDFSDVNDLIFRIRSKASWQTRKLVLQWYNGNTPVGNAIPFGQGSYGFSSTNTTLYQLIDIQLSDFGNITGATRLREIVSAPSGSIGLYLDNIMLVSETAISAPTGILAVNGIAPIAVSTVNNVATVSSTLNNAGNGFRLLAGNKATIKTLFGSNTIIADSSSNANGITFKADTSVLATQYDLTQISSSGGLNIYNSDSVLSSNRTVKGGGRSLLIDSTSSITFKSQNAGNVSDVSISGGSNDIQSYDDASTKYADIYTDPNHVLLSAQSYVGGNPFHNLQVFPTYVWLNAQDANAGSPAKLVIDRINETSDTVISPVRIAVWDGDTLKSALASSISTGGDTTSLSNRINNKWSLTGNAGTTAGTNFLGTTDGTDLVFKVNSAEKLRLKNSSGILMFSQDVSIGWNGVSGSARNVSLGGGYTWTGTRNVDIGSTNMSTSASSQIGIGNTATTTASNAIAIGTQTTAASAGVAIGTIATAAANSIVISGSSGGASALTDQFVATPSQWYINQAAGTGATDQQTTHTSYAINSTAAFGTNRWAGDLNLAGGKATGLANSSDVVFQTTSPISTGTTLQTLSDRWYVKGGLGQLTNIAQPNAAAAIDVSSSSQGVLFPRLTTAQRLAIDSQVTSIIITNAGTVNNSTGTTPTVSFSGGGGTGAAATIRNTGVTIGQIIINNAGSGYTSAPTVSFANAGSAAATAVIGPPEGLEVYDTTLHKKFTWDGTTWQASW